MTDPQYGSGPSEGVPPPQQSWDYPPPPQAGQYPPAPGQFPPPPGQYPPPQWGQYPPQDQFPPPQDQYPPQGQYPPQDFYQFPPPLAAYVDPMAPFGRDPLTGEPFSDKSKVIAGLLQLIGLFGLLGFGRIYLGQTGLGVAQLVGGILITAVTCGFGIIVPFVWGIIDATMMFAGSVRDINGRPLRDGT